MWRLFLFLLLLGCATTDATGTIQVHFCGLEDCSRIYLQHLLGAEQISCAFYNLNNPEISTALKYKKAKLFTEYAHKSRFNNTARYDYKKSLMHNKFCILDKIKVITGSYNPTKSRYYDNIVIVNSPILAKNYLQEFGELYYDRSVSRVPQPIIQLNQTRVENYFCPEDDCKQQVMKTLNKANKSIYFMLSSFTDQDVANILLKKSKTIQVQGLLDKIQAQNKWSVYNIVQNFTNLIQSMHNKVFIIDESTVVTGSYNPTKSADEQNDENILIIYDSKISDEYLNEYKRISAVIGNDFY